MFLSDQLKFRSKNITWQPCSAMTQLLLNPSLPTTSCFNLILFSCFHFLSVARAANFIEFLVHFPIFVSFVDKNRKKKWRIFLGTVLKIELALISSNCYVLKGMSTVPNYFLPHIFLSISLDPRWMK